MGVQSKKETSCYLFKLLQRFQVCGRFKSTQVARCRVMIHRLGTAKKTSYQQLAQFYKSLLPPEFDLKSTSNFKVLVLQSTCISSFEMATLVSIIEFLSSSSRFSVGHTSWLLGSVFTDMYIHNNASIFSLSLNILWAQGSLECTVCVNFPLTCRVGRFTWWVYRHPLVFNIGRQSTCRFFYLYSLLIFIQYFTGFSSV